LGSSVRICGVGTLTQVTKAAPWARRHMLQ
jgi:hypothetical protein